MKVTLLNYSKGQKITHSSIIILKGQILLSEEGHEGSNISSSEATVGGLTESVEIWHQHPKHDKENPVEIVPYRDYKNRFVAVIELRKGANEIQFFEKKTGAVFDQFELHYCPEEVINNHDIRILYIFGAKEEERLGGDEDIGRKLLLGVQLVQTLFAEKLFENGFDRRSFKLDCHCDSFANYVKNFEINLKAEQIALMSTSELWEYIAKEIRNREEIWNSKSKYVAFVAHAWKAQYYEHGHVNFDRTLSTDVDEKSISFSKEKMALGGGGLAITGTKFLDIWPSSVSNILETVFSKVQLRDELEKCAAMFGAVEKTEGSLYATSLGSVMHEVGHIFDLGHTDGGLMGTQFNRIDTCLSPVLSYPPMSELFRSKLGSDLCPLLRPKVGLPVSGCLSEDFLSIGISCATLLYFHKWFQPNLNENENSGSSNLSIIKNKISSRSATLVTLQVRDVEDERLLKSWTFIDISPEPEPHVVLSPITEFTLAKNHIPIPVCQRGDSNKALVVVEDCMGNLIKSVVSRDILSESFTVIRRRT